jgi:hypothetical protein
MAHTMTTAKHGKSIDARKSRVQLAEDRLQDDLSFYMRSYARYLSDSPFLDCGRWKRFLRVFYRRLASFQPFDELPEAPSPCDLIPAFARYASALSENEDEGPECELAEPFGDVLGRLMPSEDLLLPEGGALDYLIPDLQATIISGDLQEQLPLHDFVAFAEPRVRKQLAECLHAPDGEWEQTIKFAWEQACARDQREDSVAAAYHPFQLALRRTGGRMYFESALRPSSPAHTDSQKQGCIVKGETPGELIRRKCAERGMSLFDFCSQRPTIDPKTVRRIIAGERVHSSSLKKLAQKLDVSIQELTGPSKSSSEQEHR